MTVSLSSSDASSPPTVTFYRIGDGPVTTYTAPITFDTEGSHTLRFWSRDNAEPANVEAEQSRRIMIDRTPPALTSTLKAAYAGQASFTYGLTDAFSDVAAATWRLDGALLTGAKVTGNQALVAAPGAHSLSWFGMDAAGNEATGSVSFVVKRAQSLARTPAKSTLTLTRVRGVATYRAAVVVKATSAVAPYTGYSPLAGKRVILQSSTNGRTWKTVATRTTSATGAASYNVRLIKAGKVRYRWYSPGDAAFADGTSAGTIVTVR